MRKTAVILAAVLLAGSLSACAGGAEATHEQAEAAEVLVVDPNAGPGHAGEEKTAAHHALSGEMEAPFVPRAAAEPVSPAVITEIPQPVHHAETPTAAPTAAPTNTPTPTVTPTLTPTPSHQHKWVTETIVDKEAYDEEVLNTLHRMSAPCAGLRQPARRRWKPIIRQRTRKLRILPLQSSRFLLRIMTRSRRP